MKRSKKSYSLAAKRGWVTRRRNLRSAAARRGWETRKKKKLEPLKKGITVTIGYDSSKDNSWYLTVIINTHKRLSDSKTAEVVSKLAGQGHFDGMEPIDDESDKPPSDYQFCTFYNFEMVKARDIRIKQGHALLYSWYRNEAFL